MSLDYMGKIYEDENGGFMVVTGIIYDPAVILKNPISGKKDVRVIDSNHFKSMKELPQEDVLNIVIGKLNEKSDYEEKFENLADKYEILMNKYCALVDENIAYKMETGNE